MQAGLVFVLIAQDLDARHPRLDRGPGRTIQSNRKMPYRLPLAPKATRGLNGESPSFGRSTTTGAPTFTRLYRSITSSLVSRMQPDEMAWPIYSGWLVPWTRNRV